MNYNIIGYGDNKYGIKQRGAQQLGWDLDKLLTMTLQAMAANEDLINEEFEEYKG